MKACELISGVISVFASADQSAKFAVMIPDGELEAEDIPRVYSA
jgi:hypothetical protein